MGLPLPITDKPWFLGDQREKRGGWAPGDYTNKCGTCGEPFVGDKRATSCSDCAYKEEDLTEVLAFCKTRLMEGLKLAFGIPDSWCVDYTHKSKEEWQGTQKEIAAYNAMARESNRQLKIRKAQEAICEEYPITMQCIRDWCDKMREKAI